MGAKKNVFCVDYSIGARYEERKAGKTEFDSPGGDALAGTGALVRDRKAPMKGVAAAQRAKPFLSRSTRLGAYGNGFDPSESHHRSGMSSNATPASGHYGCLLVVNTEIP